MSNNRKQEKEYYCSEIKFFSSHVKAHKCTKNIGPVRKQVISLKVSKFKTLTASFFNILNAGFAALFFTHT